MKKFKNIFSSFLLGTTLVGSCLANPPETASPTNLHTMIMEKNPCYTSEKRRLNPPTGIMIHSTAEPGVMAKQWYELWNKSLENGGKEVAVHAFLDNLEIYQYLPWNHRSWHCGRAYPGGPTCNDTHISIEMCEPISVQYTDERHSTIKVFDPQHPETGGYNPATPENIAYFGKALKNMVDLCAYLMRMYSSITIENIISHAEGAAQRRASNHVDPTHWWSLHAFDMEMFRQIVADAVQRKPIKYTFDTKGKFVPYWR